MPWGRAAVVGARVMLAVSSLAAHAAIASAQSVTLQIKPHAGDTLRMRLDQQSEVTGVRKLPTGESSAMVMTTMRMFSRAIVEANDDRSTTVLAVTDSVRLTTTDDRVRGAMAQAETQLRGQHARFRLFPDGSIGIAQGGAPARGDVAQVVSLMPATFPARPISVGDHWDREMPLPAGMQLGAQLSGKLRVTFRFDSLTHDGDWAFVSLRGDVQPATGPGAASGIALERGTVNGTMLVDQKRGWLTESWFNIVVSSLQTLPRSAGAMTLHVQTRITQHMHTFDRR